ncbi:MAG: VCBS repeat-containing protein, partial [Ignavibacteria bacterium]|nr:VCBS repeat-containing protein [Ignavibacteria bacterium]
YFSPDSGLTWNSIASNIPTYMESYSSIVSSASTNNALIRISDASDAATFDESDGVFTIIDTTKNKIILSLPNGGENWQVGTNQYIAWTNSNLSDLVNIDYTTDDGLSWNSVASNVTSMYPTYMWMIPNTPSTLCKIKVYDASDTSVFDESDAVFTIQQLEQFTEQTSISLLGLGLSSVAWGDYNNDGYLDILLTGRNDASHPFTIIYKNNGNGTFTEQTNATLTSASSGSAAWGDYDNDGYLDVLLTGYTISGPVSQIYKNNGDGTFALLTSVSLPGVGNSSVAWGDYDNDGKLDILLTGNSFGARISKIYKNNGNGIFTEQTSVLLTGVYNSSVAWGDYDNDGYLDILLTGLNDVSGQVSIIYKNNGDGTFTEQTSVFLAGVEQGSVAWGDYDNDGYLDILLTGLNGTNQISKIYKNNWDGTFTEQTSASLTGVSNSSVAWGDYNNDGLLDILLTGYEMNNNPISKIYKNMGEGIFDEQTSASLIGVANSSAVWGDYDNDGALDILLTGYTTGSGYVSKIYKNINAVLNTASTAPTNLTSSVSGNDVSFNWDKSYDEQTPQNGLSYNLLIGSTLESVDVLSPMANKTNGFRRIVKPGNNQTNSWTIKNLPGGTYLWSVQAIDAAFTGSPFASQEVFTVGEITNTLLLTSPNGGENFA